VTGRRSDRAEIALTCRACDPRKPVVVIHLDDDERLAVMGKPGTEVTESFVRELGSVVDRPDLPQKLTVVCDRGHEMQVNLPPLIAELATMPSRRVRRVV
jgi:hypothetical protein